MTSATVMPERAAIAALLGPARARVLEATRSGASTTELSRYAGISLASASYHASILRAAGLVETRRRGKAVHHLLTRLGASLLAGARAPGHSASRTSRAIWTRLATSNLTRIRET
ncbi:MAG TPA: winged helix-turn-helix domain-containing protein [Amycolatopsis sp.]